MKNNYLSLTSKYHAERLKQLGFDWPCNYFFKDGIDVALPQHPEMKPLEGHISVPTVELAFKWLREVKGIHSYVCTYLAQSGPRHHGVYFTEDWNECHSAICEDYEDAEMHLLSELLGILK